MVDLYGGDDDPSLADAIVAMEPPGDAEPEPSTPAVSLPGVTETASLMGAIVDIGPVAEAVPRESAEREPRVGGCCECGGRTGGARDAGPRCIVGGVEFAVGGWGRYAAERRQAEWEISGRAPADAYPGRSYIGGADVVAALSARIGAPLKAAAGRLAAALGRLEDLLCEPTGEGLWECASGEAIGRGRSAEKLRPSTLVTPALTSADVNAFLAEPETWTDIETLSALADDAGIVAATLGTYLDALPALAEGKFPPLPTRMVQTNDSNAVIKLEAATVPYVTSLEEYQAGVASRLDAVANVIDKKIGK